MLRAGVLAGGRVLDTERLALAAGLPEGEWTSNRAVLAAGPEALAKLGAATADAAEPADAGALDELALGPPVVDPDKIICLGLNYQDHATESAMDLPAAPMLFAKFRNALIGPRDSIVAPRVSTKIDYEAEVAVVIGTRCKDVSAEDATGVLAGAMALNDVTARDVQHATSQWTAGKALDTFARSGRAHV